jgi:hypothetical protein
LKRKLCYDPVQPAGKYPCNFQLFRGGSLKLSVLIRDHVPAKPRAYFRVLLKERCHSLVKSMRNPVVAVQQMDQMAARALETRIEVPAVANVLRLTKKGNPPAPECRDDCLRVVLS